MKNRLTIVLLLILFCIICGNLYALDIRVEANPESAPGEIDIGTPFSIDIYMNNYDTVTADPVNGYRMGISMPLAFYSPDGSIDNIIHTDVGGDGPTGNIQYLSDFTNYFDFFFDITPWSYDGALPDSLNFTGIGMNGWPNNLGEQLYFQFFFEASQAGYFCIDSIAGRTPTYDWLFDPPSPSFGGPYCWEIVDTASGFPEIICPMTATDTFLCQSQELCLELNIYNDTLVNSYPGSWANDTLCFTPDTAGSYLISVGAHNEYGSDSCQFIVNVDLNTPPVVDAGIDTTIFQCETAEFCFPVVAFDIDNNLQSITVSNGYYDSLAGNICFTPAAAGLYCIELTAQDRCGETARDTVCITVESGELPQIDCPAAPLDFDLCSPGQICIPINVNPPTATVGVTHGVYLNGELCLEASSSGQFVVGMSASNLCGQDSCEIVLNIHVNSPPELYAGEDTTVFQCTPEEICFPPVLTDIDDNIQSVAVSYGNYDSLTGDICFTPINAGTYCIVVMATDTCGAYDVDTVCYNVVMNSPPSVDAGNDTTISLCSSSEICLPISAFDNENNIQTINTSFGYIDTISGSLCFTPENAGTYCMELNVIDSCGASDTDTLCVTVELNEQVSIDCPDLPLQSAICGPQQICLPLNIVPSTAFVDVSFGSYSNGQLCFMADTAGFYMIDIAATDECGTDSCRITVNVDMDETPSIVCPSSLDTMLCSPGELCLPLSITPESAIITTSSGSFQDGELCFIADSVGLYEIFVTAETDCGTDSCLIQIMVHFNSPPVVDAGSDFTLVQCFSDDVCFPVDISDAEGDITSIVVSSGYYNDTTGLVCFEPVGAGLYEIVITATDLCNHQTSDTILITLEMDTPPEISCPSAPLSIDLCAPDQICYPLAINPSTANVTASFGTYSDGELCFTPDSSGLYEIIVAVENTCGTDTCLLTFIVTINNPPTLSMVSDTSVFQCTSSEICIPVLISDIDQDIMSINLSQGVYDSTSGTVCFSPGTDGTYSIVVTVSDSCGAFISDTTTIELITGQPPYILDCPGEQVSVNLCASGELCFPVNFSFPPDSVFVSFGSYADGFFCFTADSAGLYEIDLEAINSCGADSCFYNFMVLLNEPPLIDAGADTSVSICSTSVVCRPVSIMDPDNNIFSVAVSYGYYDSTSGELCFPADTSGVYCLEINAEDSCGATATDSLCITVELIDITQINCPSSPMTKTLCAPDEICLPLEIMPATSDVSVSFGSYDSGLLCFMADTAGIYSIRIIAENECNADTCLIIYNVHFNSSPLINTGDDYSVFQCTFSEICFPISVADADNNLRGINISSGYYNTGTGEICFTPDSAGVFCIEIEAIDSCEAADRDTICITVESMVPPQITCPSNLDTLINLDLFSEACFELEIIGEQTTVTVIPDGYYDNGFLCMPISQTDTFLISVIAENSCGRDSCEIAVGIVNYGSVVVDTNNIWFGMTDTSTVLPDSQQVQLGSTGEPGLLEWDVTIINDGGWLTTDKLIGSTPDDVKIFIADTAFQMESGTYTSLLRFSDILYSTDAYVTISLFIESGVDVGDQFVSPGTSFSVPITLYTDKELSGFNIPLVYRTEQPEQVVLDSIVVDSALAEDYSITGLILDDTSMIVYRPIQEPPVPDSLGATAVANAYYTAASDAGNEVIIIDTTTLDYGRALYSYKFYDTQGDSTVPDFDEGTIIIGNPAAVSGKIVYYDRNRLVPDVNLNLSSGIHSFDTIAADGFYEFYNIPFDNYLISPTKPDNDPGVSIADVIKIQRHIVELERFDSPYKYRSADVNLTQTISVADVVDIRRYLAQLETLVSGNWSFVDSSFIIDTLNWYNAPDFISLKYLGLNKIGLSFIAIRMGDVNNTWIAPGASAPAKLAPEIIRPAFVRLIDAGGVNEIEVDIVISGSGNMAGLEMHFDYDPNLLVFNRIESEYLKNVLINHTPGECHLVWNDIRNQFMLDNEATAVKLFFNASESFKEATAININKAEVVDNLGDIYSLIVENVMLSPRQPDGETDSEELLLPDSYYLSYNRPNPFNPSTEIRFGLPKSSHVQIDIFNILGQRVATPIDAYLTAGEHSIFWNANSFSSGVYFYRMRADEFKDTKKMLLLK